ncbi:MAG: hypothetical protein JWO86_6430 [Myxococcaceae bacterium]|nr:hypothetical protein [Myxococcaceae bacterium]MEA2747988.1 hypothetical protein [Myxococcales bacterium]
MTTKLPDVPDVLPHADMKPIGALGVILGGAMIIGCASNAPRANTPAGAFEVAQEQLSHAIGTTTLTSAPVAKAARDPNPLFLTGAVDAPAAARTWGAAPSEQASTEDDLARNPYRETRDIYDPN